MMFEEKTSTVLLNNQKYILPTSEDKVLLNCAKIDSYELFVAAFYQGYSWYKPSSDDKEDDLNEINIAIKNKNLRMVKFAQENGCNYAENIFSIIFENDCIECLPYLYDKINGKSSNICNHAAEEGALECLKFLHKKGEKCDEKTCDNAAFYGNLHCLKYLHENGSPWDGKNIVETSKMNNHLEIYQYAVKNGCPDDKKTYSHFYTLNNISS